MKALTLWQPWATLVAIGAKHMESRSWYTGYRGPLAIHAAKTFPAKARALCSQEPFKSALEAAGITDWRQLRLGAVVATCWLHEIWQIRGLVNIPSEPERSFGDYSAWRYVWALTRVARLEVPIPAKGAQGLWEWEPPA